MAQITKTQIESELHRLAELIGAQPNQLPTVDNNQDFARPNIALSTNGTAYYEAHERGEELFSIPAFDLEHLMFMAFKDITFSMAVEHERKNRNPNEDFRRQLFSSKLNSCERLTLTGLNELRKKSMQYFELLLLMIN